MHTKKEESYLRELLPKVYNEVVDHVKKENKYIREFLEAGYDMWTHSTKVCLPGICDCLEQTSLFSLAKSVKNWPPCTPEMYDFMVTQGLVKTTDVRFVASLCEQMNHPSRFRLLDHLFTVVDQKQLVEYRSESGRTIPHLLLTSPIDIKPEAYEDWLIGVFRKFQEIGFDLRTKTYGYDRDEEMYIKDKKFGETLLDRAVLRLFTKMIKFLVDNGVKFEDGDFYFHMGAMLPPKPPADVEEKEDVEKKECKKKEDMEEEEYKKEEDAVKERDKKKEDVKIEDSMDKRHNRIGATAVQYILCNIHDENDEVQDSKENMEEKDGTQKSAENIEEKRKTFETVETCIRLGYPIDLPDWYGNTLRDYVNEFVRDEYRDKYLKFIQ